MFYTKQHFKSTIVTLWNFSTFYVFMYKDTTWCFQMTVTHGHWIVNLLNKFTILSQVDIFLVSLKLLQQAK